MITLYTFGPAWGLPDPSPFVTKAIVLLKMSGLPFETDTSGFRKAPRGKLPYIRDGGEIVSDSTLIRLHLEQRHNIDFERGLTPEQRGVAWAAEKMCEDHLYWLWCRRAGSTPAISSEALCAFSMRCPRRSGLLLPGWSAARSAAALHGQGSGRYSPMSGQSSRIAPSPRSPRSWAISPI